jgi:hypothetical protein
MLDLQDTALDRRSKGAKGAGLSVQDPLPRKVGLLQRDTESGESEKDSRNNKRLDQQGAPLKSFNVQLPATNLRTGRPQNMKAHCKSLAERANTLKVSLVRSAYLSRRPRSATFIHYRISA